MREIRVLIELDDGTQIEAREIKGVPPGADTLIFFSRVVLRRDDLEALEKRLSEKTGKACVIVDRYMDRVLGV